MVPIYLTIFVILVIFLFQKDKIMNDLIPVVSTYDNNTYLVRQLPDKEDAVLLLSKIRQNFITLTQYLEKNYPEDKRTRQILRRFNPDKIVETEKGSSYTSYSVNKGEKMVLCLRSRDGNNNLIDLNTLMFVALHEYTHILTESVGHTDEFWENFRWVLKNAIGLGIYNCVDYQANPQKYCGIEVNNSPLQCSELQK